MCPSFSLCACRNLKIRSCLRMPLAPGSSSVRAILVSSVMFFSFSSAMVMFTYGILLRRGKEPAGQVLVAAHPGLPGRAGDDCWGSLDYCPNALRLARALAVSQCERDLQGGSEATETAGAN